VAVELTEIVVPCREPAAVAAFWAGALGWSVQEHPGGVRWMSRSGSAHGDLLLVFAPGGAPASDGAPASEGPSASGGPSGSGGARVRLALRPVGSTTAEERARLVALGARITGDGPGGPEWISLTDPEGNRIILGPPLAPGPERPSL
jgi:catechol 2,3-dioxygenase-like lactoylglutathione lyase family enzyme